MHGIIRGWPTIGERAGDDDGKQTNTRDTYIFTNKNTNTFTHTKGHIHTYTYILGSLFQSV